MRQIALFLFITICITAPGLVSAQEPSSKTKIKELNFEEDYIEGESLVPSEVRVGSIENSDLISLVQAREDFVSELIRAVESL